jgi:hypothetical protein
VIKEVTEQEFWMFFGIVVSARALGRKGDMWDRHEWQDDGILPKANFDERMKECHFEQIRKCAVCIFAELDEQDEDPWRMMSSAFKQHNENRKAKVMSSIEKTLDETMAAFWPQTRNCGDVPNLSSIPLKPEPLGMELNVIVRAVTGIAVWLELQRGKCPKTVCHWKKKKKEQNEDCSCCWKKKEDDSQHQHPYPRTEDRPHHTGSRNKQQSSDIRISG